MKMHFRNGNGLKLCGIVDNAEINNGIGIVICHGFTGSKDSSFIPKLQKN